MPLASDPLPRLRRLAWAAILAGACATATLAPIHLLRLAPLIAEAERYERRELPASASRPARALGDVATNAPGHSQVMSWRRLGWTVLSQLLSGVGFGLLLAAAIDLRGRPVDWRRGIVWGGAGFATFVLAPAAGLPPELPGAAAAAVDVRQMWWLATVACTAVGLGWLAFGRGGAARLWALPLLLLPHLAGAPLPPVDGNSALPAELAAQFAAISMAALALFWGVLGAVCGGVMGGSPLSCHGPN